MPALFMHNKLGQDVLKNTDEVIKKEISNNIEYYNMFCQGWDNLYYHFPKWNYYKKIGFKSHKNNVDKFFYNAIKYIKDNNLEDNSKLTNLIYGILNHYTMDTLIHPFINYQVKNLNLTHARIEFSIDSNIRTTNKGNIYKILIPRIKLDKDMKEYIDYIYINTHNLNNMGKVWFRSHNNGYILYRYFMNDRFGIKTFLYRIVDIFNPTDFKFHKNTFYIKDFDKRILNEEHNNWHPPKNKEEIYNYSFEELYNNTLKVCVKLNKLAYEIIHKNKDIEELLAFINNISLKNMPKLLH